MLRQQLQQFSNAILRHEFNASTFIGTPDLNRRLGVYQNNYQLIRLRSMEQVFPILMNILGKNYFRQICHHYIAQYPAENNLNQEGQGLASFLKELQKSNTSDLEGFPYIADLSRLEWLLHQAYYAETATAPSENTVTREEPDATDDIRFQLRNDIAVLSTDWPIFTLWQQSQRQAIPSCVSGLDEKNYLCIFRYGFRPFVTRIKKPLFQLIQAIHNGDTLNTISHCEYCATLKYIPLLLKRGWITSWQLERPI